MEVFKDLETSWTIGGPSSHINHAEIKLQSLMDHTVIRLCKQSVLVKLDCDGVEQNKYKQTFSEENCSEEILFSISMVPI
ncbi:hypothetical protein PR048_002179 [Dryococelus australis]|uniref:Uncharacterized protein n=1 Tax=Dryococelus australis TaxID=614101 RepID=A0ABQ9IJG4_9NEOP|nr:hypothetical protein PR048_002179 [Dryococelus australis]